MRGSSLDDLQSIIAGCLRGEQYAFGRLVARYQDAAVGYGYGLLGDYQLAQDAAQEAFLTAFQALPSLREPLAFPGWFRKIVFKSCDRIKRRKTIPSFSLTEITDFTDASTDPAAIVSRAEKRAQRASSVTTALQSLPETDRSIITLYYMGEHSVAEIGAFLQLSEPAVKKRLQRARERLKERILNMIGESLSENAPSRSLRFIEAATLLNRAVKLLEQDQRVEAAWLADAFGLADDSGWSSAWLQVIVQDEHIDAFILSRHEQAALLGTPLIVVEAPQNAPAGGAYLMALYDGEAGPYEINWYWQPRSGAVIPEAVTIPGGETRPVTRVLVDKIGLPRPEGLVIHSEYNRVLPAVLKEQWDARPEDEAKRAEPTNCMNLFWAMLLISARWAAALPSEPEPRHLEFIKHLLSKVQSFCGVALEFPPSRPYLGTVSKVAMLRDVAATMERLAPIAATLGVEIDPAVPVRVHRFLDMVAQS